MMKVLLVLMLLLSLCTAVFKSVQLSLFLIIAIGVYIIVALIYRYNCKQVDALLNILCNINISNKPLEEKDKLREELLDGMNILQRYIFKKRSE